VVNLELLTKSPEDKISVARACSITCVQFGRLLVESLSSAGALNIAPLLGIVHDGLEPDAEAEHYALHLNCKAFAQFRSVIALATLQNQYVQLEAALLRLIALRARKELNAITVEPPLATTLAHEIEALRAGSPTQPDASAALLNVKRESLNSFSELSQAVAQKKQLTWTEMVRLDAGLPELKLLFWAQQLIQAVSTLHHSVDRLECHFEAEPLDSAESQSHFSYLQLLKNKQRRKPQMQAVRRLQRTTQTGLWEKEAQGLIAEKNFFALSVCVETVVTQLSAKVDEWTHHVNNRGLKQKPRALGIENFHYADSLRRTLQELGESLEDACSCADQLLIYCKNNRISALDLMDDEVWSLFPRVNRENIKQARLKVRHTDSGFPLSVVHRDWITQVTELALTQSQNQTP
jgi:hypothetical protein